jgi:2-amino-4-hydroxy-6-hydroxymethyldihydropteridine diphosphokinase/dihydropteroate synthase
MTGSLEVVIGLGSNASDSLHQLRRARALIRSCGSFELLASSPLYESEALLPEGSPSSWSIPYLNAALRVRTSLTAPHDLLHKLKELETRLGRIPGPRWSPRVIDLDLLSWSAPDFKSSELEIPHAALQCRPFAWLPWQDCMNDPAPHTWRYAPAEKVPQHTRRSDKSWTQQVGILNLTPDSFSDGRPGQTLAQVENKVRRLIQQGIEVLDVGAESTRPGATPLTASEEWARLENFLPLIFELRKSLGFLLSLDSRHPETYRQALELDRLDWLNDVEGFQNAELRKLASQCDAQLVVMHSLSVPPKPDLFLPPEQDPTDLLQAWLACKIQELHWEGIPVERILFDPGIGFGKTPAQNLVALTRSHEFHRQGVGVLIGHSRKGFLSRDASSLPESRDLETAILTAHLSRQGVDFVRIHDPVTQGRALQLGARLP